MATFSLANTDSLTTRTSIYSNHETLTEAVLAAKALSKSLERKGEDFPIYVLSLDIESVEMVAKVRLNGAVTEIWA